jgi:AraC-like DNA-binding protein
VGRPVSRPPHSELARPPYADDMPHDVAPGETTGTTPRLSRTVRDALHWLHDHAQERIAVPDVAAAVNISPRGLQKAFHREVGVSPGQYLRALRLEGVRRDLQSADPTERPTVAEVARRWHFSNAGRMAADYRAAFGSAPSAALRYFEPDDEPGSRIPSLADPGSERRRFRLVLDVEIGVEDPDATLASALRRAEHEIVAWQGYRPDGGTEDLVAFVLNDAVRRALHDTDGLRLTSVNPLLRLPEADGSYVPVELPAWGPTAAPPTTRTRAAVPRVPSETDQEDSDG